MTAKVFVPTDEQARIIGYAGSAFVAACPGAGKTSVMVERARLLLAGRGIGRDASVPSGLQSAAHLPKYVT